MSAGLPTLAGPTVVLRQLVEADVARLFEVFSDPEVMRYWSRGPFADEGEARALLDEAGLVYSENELQAQLAAHYARMKYAKLRVLQEGERELAPPAPTDDPARDRARPPAGARVRWR